MDDTLRSSGRELILLRRLARTHGIGAWELDLDGLRLQWTDEVFRIHDLDASSYVPTLEGALEFIAPEGRAAMAAAVKRAIDTGEGWDLELPLVSARGARRWVRSIGEADLRGGRCIGLSGTLQDITDARRARDALRARSAENRKLATVAESTTSAVIIADAANRIEWVNASFTRITGYRAVEVAGRCPCELLTGSAEVGQRLFAQCSQRLERGEPVSGVELQLRRRDGSPYWVEVELRAVTDESGALIHFVHIHTDITERRLAAQRFEALSQRLRLATESAGLGVFEREACEYRVIRGDGSDGRPLSRMRRDDGRDGAARVIGVEIDVTQRRLAEEQAASAEQALNETRERLRLAAEAGGIASWERDLSSGAARWDEELFAIFGLDPAQGPPAFDGVAAMVHPDDVPAFLAAWRELRGSTRTVEWENRYCRGDGSVVHVVTRARCHWRDGAPWRVVGATIDVTASRQAAYQLRQALQRLKLAAEVSGIGVWERDLRSGAGCWDPTMFGLYGLPVTPTAPTREELLALVIEEDRQALLDAWHRFDDSDAPVEVEFRIRRPAGAVAYLTARGVLERDAKGAPLRAVGTTLDVTAHRMAQQRLREFAEWLQLAGEATGVGFFQHAPDGTAVFNDRQLMRMFGFDPDSHALTNDDYLRRVLPEDHPLILAARDRALQVDAPVDAEYRIDHPARGIRTILTRRVRQCDGAGQVIGVIGAALDVTESRSASEALRAAERELRDALERMRLASSASGLGTWERSLVCGAARWDEPMFRLYGLPPSEHPPSRDQIYAMMSEAQAAAAHRSWLHAIETGAPLDLEEAITTPAGEHRVLYSRATVVRGTDGRPQRVFGITLDMTARRQTETELRRAKEQLELAAQASNLGIWSWDLADGALSVDDRIRGLLGMPGGWAPDPAGRLQCVHPEDLPRVRTAYDACIAGAGTRGQCEYRIVRPDGEIRHVYENFVVERDVQGRPHRLVGTHLDVTGIRRAQLERDALAERLQQVAAAVGLGIWEWDPQGRRSEWNDQMYGLFGRSREWFADHVWTDVMPPQDAARARSVLLGAIEAGGPFECEFRVLLPDGRVRWLASRGRAERDGDQVRVLGVNYDITERRSAEEQARELAERLQMATGATGIAVWFIRTDNCAMLAEDLLAELHGIAPQSPKRLWAAIEATIVAEDLPGLKEASIRARQTRAPLAYEYRTRHPDGQIRHLAVQGHYVFDEQGAVTRMMGVTFDITDRKRAEQELREAEAHARELLERMQLTTSAAEMGLWEVNLETGQVVWDDLMYRLYGRAPESSPDLPQRWTDAVHPDDRERVGSAVGAAVRTGTALDLTFRVALPGGTVRHVAHRGRLRRAPDGRPLRLYGVTWDVTERQMAESALRAKEAAERASQAKTEFLSRMSHELRTPLNAILGFAQVLELDPSQPLSPTQAERVGQISRAGWHLLTLINEILDLSRIEAGALKLTMSSVPVAALIDECTTLIQTDAARRRLRVAQMQQPTAAIAVWADPTRLKQVLLNLLSNAVKYNRDGGQIIVSHEADRAGNAVIAVRDTGAGLSSVQIERLFEPFNRLGQENTPIEGTGIGLTIARRLVEQMGGQLQVRSTPGEGSEFRVTLPAATAEPAVAVDVLGAVGIGLHESCGEVRGNVLYVEDNESNVEVVRQLMALRPNVRLHVAGDGASARVLAAVCQPDLVLLDMRLPDTDGYALLRELQRQPATAGIACVALSANALPTDVAQARAQGFTDYWTKPLEATQFLRRLDHLLTRPRAG